MGKLNSNEIPFNNPAPALGSPAPVQNEPQTPPLEQAYIIVSRPIETARQMPSRRASARFPLGMVFLVIMVFATLLGLGVIALKNLSFLDPQRPSKGQAAVNSQTANSSAQQPSIQQISVPLVSDSAVPPSTASGFVSAGVASASNPAPDPSAAAVPTTYPARAHNMNARFESVATRGPAATQTKARRDLPLLPDP